MASPATKSYQAILAPLRPRCSWFVARCSFPPSPRLRGEGRGEGHVIDAEFLPAQYPFVSTHHHSKTGLSESLSIQDTLFSRHRAQSAPHVARHQALLSAFVQGRQNQRCMAGSDAVAET